MVQWLVYGVTELKDLVTNTTMAHVCKMLLHQEFKLITLQSYMSQVTVARVII